MLLSWNGDEMNLALISNFLLALALGALIGLEREYARYRRHTHDYAGIRTFPLISLFGALCAFLGERFNPWILVVGILIIGTLILISYFMLSRKHKHYHGATSEVAGLLAFFIGVLSYLGEMQLAIILAVAITIILYSRSMLHRFAQHLKKEEMRSTLTFVVIAFVVLPFLPNKGYGPYQLFNPFLFWLMVVFISGISFVGYILMKWVGEKGMVLGAMLGGLASSTAVTLSFSERSKQQHLHKALALGVILANGVMFARVLLEIFVLNFPLFLQVLPIMALLILLTAGLSYFIWKGTSPAREKIELTSPFTLKPALKFAAVFALVLAFLKLAQVYLSSHGVYLISFLSGLAEMDAITVSLSQLAGTSLPLEIAARGIIIGVVANIATKTGIVLFFGEHAFSKIVATVFGLLVVAAVGLLFIF